MKDEYGRINNKAQVIRELDKLRMAYLLNDIKSNPDKYPNTTMEWVEWLNMDSGDNLDSL
jgi:hypothetical protein